MSLTWMPEAFEKILGYAFSEKSLLAAALQHPSKGGRHFERLEFLGDRILGLAIADLLYHQFTDEQEGKLAKRLAILVSRDSLFVVGTALGLSSLPHCILEDTVEALLGAIYLDGGWDATKTFVEKHWNHLIEKDPLTDPKTALQEYLQADGQPLPTYNILSVEGPSHAPLFSVQVILKEGQIFQGEGSSKQKAEFAAAKAALKELHS